MSRSSPTSIGDRPWERRVALHLPGLSCRACARRAEDVLRRVPGVLAASVRLVRDRADVRFDARRTSEGELAAAMGHAGYPVAAMWRQPSIEGLAVDLGIGLAALANLIFLRRGGAGDGITEVARIVLGGVVLFVAGAPLWRRALGLLRRGILGREALAGVAALTCFAAGLVAAALAHGLSPTWLAVLGARAAAWSGHGGAGFEAAAAIAVAALVARAAEAALHRRALRELLSRERARAAPVRRMAPPEGEAGRGDRIQLTEGDAAPADLQLDAPAHVVEEAGEQLLSRRRSAGEVMPAGAVLLSAEVTGRVVPGPADLAATLDAEVRAALALLAGARLQPAQGTWEDATVRGLFTAALGCATFALVTQWLLGAGPLGPVALCSIAAVLAGMSPSSILIAAPAARAVAILRARTAGVVVRDARTLEALARVDTVCFAEGDAQAAGAAIHGLRARGVRALLIRDRPGGAAAAIRDLQAAGARVLLVGGGGDAAALAQADAAVVVSAAGEAGASIVVPAGRAGALPALVDLGRGLRGVLRQNAAMGAAYNALLIPAAALGHVPPIAAAALVLLETLLGLANASRLLSRPRMRDLS